MSKNEILAELGEVIKGPDNPYIRDWKKSGRGVMGYFCTYMPLELFTAAGILPVRIRGAGCKDSGPADAYLSNRVCTFVRHATTLALEERYDFLDGAVFLNTCDHVRRANDVWKAKTGIGFFAFISLPRNVRESLLPWYLEEVSTMKSQVEEHFGLKVTDDSLREAIDLHNMARERLIALNELRVRERPPLTGEEMLTIAVASQVMPPKKFVEIADELIPELEATGPEGEPPRARLAVIGSELDEPGFLRAIESQGAAVVADNVCFSTRYFDQLIQNAGDPLEAICRGYFFKIPCARMIGGFPRRYEQIQGLMSRYRVDGAIFQRMKFCDPWAGEAHNLLRRKKTTGMHLLVLDREYGVISTGQIKTRVQALLEAMGK
jgi:benzoyl-CoA reductase/2-hydroxyglutaryl-CoA dehydratase subunit BcrC/BadD/HgdB